MGRLIKIHDIDEFSDVKTIPPASISNQILSHVKNLDEKEELEPFIREILYDPNETPHGPTEIADILTTHVHVRGDKRFAAFVLKGKSFSQVSSQKVAHQAITDFEAYQNGNISEKRFISKMQKRKPKVMEFFLQTGDFATPPLDCEDYCDACLALFSTIHDIFLFCSDDRTTENRDWLVKDAIRQFHEDWETVQFEERKIH